MKFFPNARRRKTLSAVVNALREQNIQVSGPYRMRSGTLVFRVGGAIVTEAELLEIQRKGELNAARTVESFSKGG